MKKLFDTLSAICSRSTTKLYSTSFSLGIGFLRKQMRAPVYGIYGFVRLADEIVDSFDGYPKSSLLAELKTDCFLAIARGISVNPILHSFQSVVNQYHIDHELIHQFLDSMEMDLHDQEYTEQTYEKYILGSAQVVGLMCLRIFVNGDDRKFEQLKLPAMKLGAAFQKVNFLRDVHADYKLLNRTYFPGVDLSTFDDASKKAIEKDIDAELTAAINGIRALPMTCRKGVYIAYVYYRALLKKICKIPAAEMMQKRTRVSNSSKLWLTFKALVQLRLNWI